MGNLKFNEDAYQSEKEIYIYIHGDHGQLCKKCEKVVSTIHMVWAPTFSGNSRARSTYICKDCHPECNTKCTKCLKTKRNNEFSYKTYYSLKSIKIAQCKTCRPYIATEKAKIRQKLYMQRPGMRKRMTERAKIRNKERRKTDLQFKLARNLRGRLSNVLKGRTKAGSSVADLGCTVEELRIHLEKQFKPGMSWDNYGNKPGQWSIDHIYPLSKLDLADREQFLKGCHYANLQPMWHVENLKKSNKL